MQDEGYIVVPEQGLESVHSSQALPGTDTVLRKSQVTASLQEARRWVGVPEKQEITAGPGYLPGILNVVSSLGEGLL